MGNVLERFVAPVTQQRDEAPPVVTHSVVRSEDHSERTGLEASEGDENYNPNFRLYKCLV